jgi:hypothetical protein
MRIKLEWLVVIIVLEALWRIRAIIHLFSLNIVGNSPHALLIWGISSVRSIIVPGLGSVLDKLIHVNFEVY